LAAVKVVMAGVCLALMAGTATAGRTHYGWLYGTEVPVERGVEIQTITTETNGVAPNDLKRDVWWTGLLVGVTDQLELALPFELQWQRTDDTEANTSLKYYGLEARYRFVTNDPVDKPAFAPLMRVAVKRDIVNRDVVRVETDLVASYEAGKVHAIVDFGVIGDLSLDDTHLELRPGVGVSVRVKGDLRLGAEAYAELSLDETRKSFAIVGPNVAWTHGRFWIAGALGIGVFNINTAPRVTWGVAF
jgi:hypothetical protein